MFRTNVLSNQQIAENAYILSLPRIVKFKAGQVIKLYVEDQQPRLYSIASGINEDELKILYDIKPQGQVTPLIRNLQPGDEVEISEPLGYFTDNDVPSFWIANGTGIAPFYSMFKSGLGAGKTLIHGGRTRDSFFYFQEEFLSFFGDKYIRCCTKEKGDDLFEGRVTQYLTQQKFLPTNQKYYLCGSAEMVVETRDVLISKNIPFSNIIAEIYF